MTRKDYEALAAALVNARRLVTLYQSGKPGQAQGYEALDHAVVEILQVLARDNPRFDAARFVAAATT